MDAEHARKLLRQAEFPADMDAIPEGQLLHAGEMIEMGISQLQQAFPLGSKMHVQSESHPGCSTHRVMKPAGPESLARMHLYRYEEWTLFASHALATMLVDGLLVVDDEDADGAARALVEKLGKVMYNDAAALQWVPIDASDPNWLKIAIPD